MSHGPPPLQGDFFGFGNLDVLSMFQGAAHSQGIPAPDSIADALHIDPGGADDDGTMALLDGNMIGAFGGDMAMGIDPMAAIMDDDAGEIDSDIISPDAILNAENQFNTVSNDVPGAGPLPASAFTQANASSSSSNPLTEFTKRRNWPAKVVEELSDLLQILDSNGRIRFVSPSITSLAGYTTEEVQDTFLKDLIHPDDQGMLVAELNESIATGNSLRMFYRMKKKDGSYAIFEAVGHAHIAAARFAPNPNNQSPFCQAVFMMARLYPTKNATLLDSFLEHKIENERLRRRIAELRREEEAEAEEAQRQWAQTREGPSDIAPSEGTGMSSSAMAGVSSEMPMPSGNLDGALTKKNLEDITASSRQDSLRDKMARFEASSADTIALLTGIVNGERMSNGNRSPTLIKGDAGIAIPLDRDSRSGEKKKKMKMAEEYVCTDCGTLDSPEWRKGPNGPKTLCNACGLRWAKKEKKRNSISTPLAARPTSG
ncbi:cutinase palindrome-binding [Trichoderma arundinaceum]|uniref:Cutinase palindrome-binding n=1 Tax=Trichoderma arundinaceum TaxID=490622 RepID=A0A395NHJ6_TRIAR|nr:cutinase palindrome-binding [Trichoderma arundinaceum]